MDTLNAIAARHSTREYTAQPVAREIVQRIVEAGLLAPTARNEQPWDFVIVTDAAMRQRIADLTDHGRFIARAPACVAVFCKDVKYYLEDGCAATQNILLAATDFGVQSCWIAGDKKPYGAEVAQMLSVPTGHRLISLITLGYGAVPGRSPDRRAAGQVLHWEHF